MAEQQQTPLYKQTRQPRKAAKVDIQDMLYTARQLQYARTAMDETLMDRLANGEIKYQDFKEYLGSRSKQIVGKAERAAVGAIKSKALNYTRTARRNELVRKWNAREISINKFENEIGKLLGKYDPKSDIANTLNQDLYEAKEAYRDDVLDNWRIRYEAGDMSGKFYKEKLLGMQKNYEPKTEQFNSILEEVRTVDNWIKAETVRERIESGKISVDKGQQLYLDLAMQMKEGTQDRLDLLNIVNDLGRQEYDSAISKENVIRTSELANSQARQTILQSQYMAGEITAEQYNQGMQDEANLQISLGVPLPEYEAQQWGAGKTGPEFKSERVQRIAGALVGDKINDPSQLAGMEEENIIRTDQGIYTRPEQKSSTSPSVKPAEAQATTGPNTPEGTRWTKIYNPADLKNYTEDEIVRKSDGIYVKPTVAVKHYPTPDAGPGAPYPTKVTNPDYLKYYKEDEIDRQGNDIYLKNNVPIKWK